MSRPVTSVSMWPTLHLNASQEGHLCSHQHALWDSGSVPRGGDVSATSQLQHQWGHRPPAGFHCSSWAGTQVRFYCTHTKIPSNVKQPTGNIDDSTCFTLISSAKCSQSKSSSVDVSQQIWSPWSKRSNKGAALNVSHLKEALRPYYWLPGFT